MDYWVETIKRQTSGCSSLVKVPWPRA